MSTVVRVRLCCVMRTTICDARDTFHRRLLWVVVVQKARKHLSRTSSVVFPSRRHSSQTTERNITALNIKRVGNNVSDICKWWPDPIRHLHVSSLFAEQFSIINFATNLSNATTIRWHKYWTIWRMLSLRYKVTDISETKRKRSVSEIRRRASTTRTNSMM